MLVQSVPQMLTPRHIQDPSKVLSFTFLPRWPLLLKRPSRISRRQSQKCRFFAELKGCRNFFFFFRGVCFSFVSKSKPFEEFQQTGQNIQFFFHHWRQLRRQRLQIWHSPISPEPKQDQRSRQNLGRNQIWPPHLVE